jgi:arsenite-transporting ATPase
VTDKTKNLFFGVLLQSGFQLGEELFIRVGSLKRNILLPRILLNHSIRGARFVEERLKITFEPDRKET